MDDARSETVGRAVRLDAQKRNPNRVNVYLDDEYAFSLSREVVAALGLRSGQRVDEAALVDIANREAYQQALDRALDFLSYRPRSEREVRQRLERKGVAPAIIDTVIARLAEQKLIDDVAFAQYWAANRERFNPRGASAIRMELRRKGVSAPIAAEAAGEIDEAAGAEAVARRRAARLRGLDYATFRRRLGAHLTRRGYSFEITGRLIDQLWSEYEDDASPADSPHQATD